MVLGFVNDKDISAIMEQMPHDARYYFASPSVRRGRTAESTLEYAASAGISGRAFGNVAEASDIMAGVADCADSSVLGLHPSSHKAGNGADFCKATFYGRGIYEWEFPAQYA